MNKYLIVKVKDPKQADDILVHVLREAPHSIALISTHAHAYKITNDLFFVSLENQAAGDFSRKDHVFRSGDNYLTYDGIPFFDGHRYAQNGWAKELFGFMEKRDLATAYDQLGGTYNLACIRGSVVQAFGGFTGIPPLFYYEDERVAAIANRQLLLTLLRPNTNLSFDLQALSWLPGQANSIGADSIYSGIKILQPGEYLTLDRTITVSTFPKLIYDAPRKELASADYDAITDHFLKDFSAIKALPFNKLSMSVTGGKDSRMILALAVKSGLTDVIDEFFTSGDKDSPEVEVAKHICKKLDLKHNSKKADKRPPFDLYKAWNNLRFHPFRHEGSICPWDGNSAASNKSTIELNGMVGELYKKFVKSHETLQIETLNQAIDIFKNYQQRNDPLSLQHDDITSHQHHSMEQTVRSLHAAGVALNDLQDIIYINNRLPMWSGQMAANTFERIRIFPLANFNAARIAYSGGHELRQTARIHMEVMKRACPELVEMPFLDTKWDKRIHPYLDGLKAAPPHPTRKPANSKNLTSWQWSFMDEGWDSIRDFLLSSPNSALFDIVDRRKLETVLVSRENIRQVIDAKEILSLINIQMLLTGQYRRDWDGDCEQETEVHSNNQTLKQALHSGINALTLSLTPFVPPVPPAPKPSRVRQGAHAVLHRVRRVIH